MEHKTHYAGDRMKPSALSILMPVGAVVALVAIGLDTTASTAATAPSFTTDSIASPSGPGATTPNLTVAADGKVYMSWLEPARIAIFRARKPVMECTPHDSDGERFLRELG